MNYVRFIFFLIFTASCAIAFGQKEYNVWYFGNQSGLDFNTGVTPQVLSNSPMQTFESSSGICDKNGNLLFYTNGDTIYNRQHKAMKGGIPSPYNQTESCTQGSMVLPFLEKPNLYFVFSNSSNESQTTNKWLRYSIVDMSKDNGYGEVITSSVPLLHRSNESMAFTLHRNGKEYWIISPERRSNTINCVKTNNGVIDTSNKIQKQLTGTGSYGTAINNQTKFSPDGKVFLGTYSFNTAGGLPWDYYFNLFRFDNATGKLYDSVHIPYIPSLTFYSEFSPDSKYLYLTWKDGNKTSIKQYDLSVWNSTAINNSAKVVYSDSSSFSNNISGLQLGPNGKIYVFHSRSDALSVIHYPNLKGAACDFEFDAITLPNKNNHGGPYYPNFWFGNNKTQDISFCEGDSAILETDYPNWTKVIWSTGDSTHKITVKTSGTYTYGVKYRDSIIYDTIKVTVKNPFTVYLGSDTAFCGNFSHLLNAGVGAQDYLWNTGDTTATKLVDMPGIYAVTVKDSNSCENGDTIKIEQVIFPNIIETTYCDSSILSVNKQGIGIKNLWSTGDTTSSITVTQKGTYSIESNSLFCSLRDSITTSFSTMPKIELGNAIYTCDTSNILLEAKDTGKYLWSTGATTSSINTTKSGSYWVSVERGKCSATDSINIFCDMWYFIPNAFTPNGDAINNGFGITGGNITSIKMKVFNRWGELLYQGAGLNPFWNGYYKETPCPDGAYMYIISIKGLRKGKLTTENVAGNVTLMR